MIDTPLLFLDVQLGKQTFIAANYLIVALFVLMNVYITSQIVRAYGPVMYSLFTGEDES